MEKYTKILKYLESKQDTSAIFNKALEHLRLYVKTNELKYRFMYERAINEWSKLTKTQKPKPAIKSASAIAQSNNREKRFDAMKKSVPSYAMGFIEH